MAKATDITRDWAHFALSGRFGDIEETLCVAGPDNCRKAGFVEAASSSFHDEALVEATRKLNSVLAEIPKDEKGRTLAFLNTRYGVFLAWVSHGVVNSFDDDATIAKALRLKVKRKP